MRNAAWVVSLCVVSVSLLACRSNGSGTRGEPAATVAPATATVTTNLSPATTNARGALGASAKVLFLHHSTGNVIWEGGVSNLLANYNARNAKSYSITAQEFPKSEPYGWNNSPFDYWNIWVKHAGPAEFKKEPTLEILTKAYQVIVFKHCFPVSDIEPDETPDVGSEAKTVANYRLQYAALKAKLRSFPNNRFILWTGAARKRSETSPENAQRAKSFFDWVRATWDEKGDNVFLWDFWKLETGGGLFLAEANATGDSHPNEAFAKRVAPFFVRRITDVIEGRGDSGSLTGE